jgi:uncharacterized protein
MKRFRRTVPAPADLGLGGVVGVPEGADLELDLRLESVMEGVLVSGTARAPLSGECVRCLDPVDSDVDVDLQELYVYRDHALAEGAGAGVDDAELQVEGDLLDLEPAVRDAVVLALPQAPLCRDDPQHTHDTTDPRWAALTGLLTADDHKTETGSTRAVPTEES